MALIRRRERVAAVVLELDAAPGLLALIELQYRPPSAGRGGPASLATRRRATEFLARIRYEDPPAP